jgi:hypothetical protein
MSEENSVPFHGSVLFSGVIFNSPEWSLRRFSYLALSFVFHFLIVILGSTSLWQTSLETVQEAKIPQVSPTFVATAPLIQPTNKHTDTASRSPNPSSNLHEHEEEKGKQLRESEVSVDADLKYIIWDRHNSLGAVLAKRSGRISFGYSGQESRGYSIMAFLPGDWLPDPDHIGPFRNSRNFLGLELRDVVPPLVGLVRSKNNVPPDLVAYALFPREVEQDILDKIRSLAAAEGFSHIASAELDFDADDEKGFVVEKVSP